MTRRNVIFKDNETNKLYVTPEFNGDKEEFEKFHSHDGFSKTWSEVLSEFQGIKTLKEFKKANRKVQEYGISCLGEIEILPCEEIKDINLIRNDEVYLIDNGVIKQII